MKKIILSALLFIPFQILLAQISIRDNGAIISGEFKSITSDNLEFHFQNEFRLIPASLLKIVTTSTALEILGPDYVYRTTIGYSGQIQDGKLFGNLIIQSGGDPTLGSKYFDETKPESLFFKIYQRLKKLHIDSVYGSVIVLESEYISYSAPRLWEDMGNYYGSSPRSFNWRDNTTVVELKSGPVGDLCTIESVIPEIVPFKIESRVIAADHNKDSAYVYGIPESNHWWIEGSIPCNRSGFKIKAALPQPANTFIQELKSYLISKGISMDGKSDFVTSDENWTPLLEIKSPTLLEIIRITNHKSNNLFADQIFLTLAKEKTGVAGWDQGVGVIHEFWKDKIDFENNFRIKDGSGLSPKNLVTTKGMVSLLIWMAENSKNSIQFRSSLAKGGQSGTLKTVFKNPGVKNKIIGKSGSMEGVLGYCGYLETEKGEQTAFCVIVNNYLKPTKEIRIQLDDIISGFVVEN